MSGGDSQLGRHYQVLMRLAKSKSLGGGDLEAFLGEITEAAANTMGIERVNVWLYDEGRTKIHCLDHYDRSTGEHSSGVEITAADYPGYFKALDEERILVADDAHEDPRTREFSKGYLDVNGITSMLDAPLHTGGRVIGIVCHEHVGPARVWTPEEQRFAASLADLASLALESSERKQAEEALRVSERRTREIITHALDAIVTVDGASIITGWNPRAELVFGWTREEAIGMSLYDTVIPERHHEAHRNGMKMFFLTGEGAIINERIEVTARDKEGREFPIELSISPLCLGEVCVFSAFIRDITDRVQAEQEVLELNTELEERVRRRTAQLKTAVTEKERLLEELQASSFELLERLRELEHKSETIQSDLERAQVIQRALLPARPPSLEGIHVDALYRPGMNVGGDLYDVVHLDDGGIALYVADSAGHGVCAAMLSVLFKQRLQMSDEEGHALAPGEVLRRVNARLSEDVLAQGLFLTVTYVLFDTKTGRLRAASAGHKPMLLRRANGESVLLVRTGPALGLDKEAEFTEHELDLRAGDRLMLYTDGLLDGLDSDEGEGILDLLLPAMTGDASDAPHRLRGLFLDASRRAQGITNGEGRDDVTLLLLEIEGGPSNFDNGPNEDGARVEEAGSGTGEPTTGGDEVLWLAEAEQEAHIAVRGRGIWTSCEVFRRLAHSALGTGKRLTVDLSGCTYLDSAFLGTLHEVVTEAPEGRVVVGRPSERLRALFDELGLEQVLAAIREDAPGPPAEPVPMAQDSPTHEVQLRLLRAHEILSELSEENRERFAGLIQTLRAELAATP